MIADPRIETTAAQTVAVLPMVVPAAEIRVEMQRGLDELHAVLTAQGLEPVGPWYTHHFRRPAETFDFEIGVPVAAEVVATGRVRPGHRPAQLVASALYHGPYENLPAAWAEFIAWIKGQGRVPASGPREQYRVGPESRVAPADYRTELVMPIEP